MNRKAAFLLMCLSPLAIADNSSSQSSAQSSAFGGAGGNAAGGMGGMGGAGGMGGIGQGGAGGLGGTGVGTGGSAFGGEAHGGTGGSAFGGEAHGGTGGVGQGGTAMNEGNHQSASMNYEQVRQSPAVFMGAPMPTAACQSTMGGFLSFIGGAGFAVSRTLKECELRELSRAAYGIGQPAMAMHVLCKAEYARDFDGCK